MNFQQLRAVHEAIHRRFNLTETAEILHASQSAVSRQIRELEEELGVDIFQRHGKRLIGLTEPGHEIAQIIERMLKDRDSLKKASDEFRRIDGGSLTLAATNAQVRYRLPEAIMAFRSAYPQVHLALHQTAPTQIAELVKSGQADLGLLPDDLPRPADLVTFKAYSWTHRFVVPKGHPLLDIPLPSLDEIARYPIITFEEGMVGRQRIDQAFQSHGLVPDIIISAADSDVIKTYVALGLGVGIIAEKSFDPDIDQRLVALNTARFIRPITTSIAVRRGTYLRSYALAFIRSLVPGLSAEDIREQVEAPAGAPIAA
ncbi:MAG: LysR substrate-binding domain-containing protein [Pseudoxanthomonas sp.]